jgi:putative nucleotidyltransferase with HDIG domain
MTTNARLYVTVFLLLGVSALTMAFTSWNLPDPVKFTCFLLLAITASVLKVSAPAMAGRMPFNFLFVLIGFFELTLQETLLIGCSSVVIECLWCKSRRASMLEVYFSVANMAVAIAVAERAMRLLLRPSLPDWFAIGVATTAFFLFNTFPMSAVTSLMSGRAVFRVWCDTNRGAVPFYAAGAALAWAFHRTSAAAGWQTSLMGLPVLYLLYRTYRLYVARVEDEKVHAVELADLHLRTIESLALAIEAKDDTTSDHLRRVQVYAVELGRELGMKGADLEALRAAAILHDIGKLAVPEYIISKPGKLTPEEFEKMKVHPVVGAEILEHVRFPYPVVPIVRAHHEKWNGTGYPFGLKGEDIPLGARILSAVDTLDALASDRQYRRALPLDEAMGKIEADSGIAFDPAVVDALKERYEELEKKAQAAKGCGLKLSTGLRFGEGVGPAAGYEVTRPIPCLDAQPAPADLMESVAQTRREIQTLFETGVLSSEMSTDEICSVFALRLHRILSFEAIAIYLIRDDRLVPAYVHGDNYRLFSSLAIPVGQGLSGWVAENRKAILNGNPSVESGYLNDPKMFSTLRSALSLPLEGSGGGVFGVISLYRESRDGFTKDHLRLMQSAVSRLALAMEQSLHRSRTDDSLESGGRLLDGVTLLRQLESELARSKRLNSPLALLVCSVDGIEQMTAGDAGKALSAVLATLEHDGRRYDTLARTAENEFAAVMPGVDCHAVEVRVQRLRQFSSRYSGVRVNVGYSAYPSDGANAEQLLAVADRRLFAARLIPPGAAKVARAQAAGSGWLQ